MNRLHKTLTPRVLLSCCLALAGLSAAHAAPGSAESAKTSFDYTVTGVVCSMTTPSGTSTVACSATGWSQMLQPGWSMQMTATISYAYSDDGLALAHPETVNLNALSGLPSTFTHEWGAATLQNNAASECLFHPCGDGSIVYTGPSTGTVLFVSGNTTPDSFSGTTTVTVSAAMSPNSLISGTASLGLVPQVVTNSVTAVPEPGTWALMILPLACMAGLASLRQRRASRAALEPAGSGAATRPHESRPAV